MHHGDRGARQRYARVQRLDLGVIPGLDLAEVDVGDRLAVELQAGLHAGEVVGDGDRAKEHRDLHRRAAVLAMLIRLRASAAGRSRRSRRSWPRAR